jgi:hypothetical protein
MCRSANSANLVDGQQAAAQNGKALMRTAGSTSKSECLDNFIAFGEHHLRHLIDEYLKH